MVLALLSAKGSGSTHTRMVSPDILNGNIILKTVLGFAKFKDF